MKLKKLTISIIFVVIIVAEISSAVITVIPDSSALKVSYLGYKSHCLFAPFSTIVSIVAAIITFLIARRVLRR